MALKGVPVDGLCHLDFLFLPVLKLHVGAAPSDGLTVF